MGKLSCRVQFAWKKSQKKQADGASSDSGDKPSARVPEPTMSPKSLRPARRTRKPLKIDNPYDDASRQMTPAPAPSVQDVPMQSPFATPPDSEDEKEPEVRAPSSGRGRGGRRGGALLLNLCHSNVKALSPSRQPARLRSCL